jgi:GT2 family glycosyltransferase
MIPFVSVIVVSYNSRAHLPGCLDSLARQTWPRHRFEVIVVDNASTDGSAALARSLAPWARVVPAGGNLGFAGGNAIGLEQAHGSVIALLNADAVASPEWLQVSVTALMAADDRVAGIAAKLVFHDRPEILNSTGLVLYQDGRGGDRGFREPDRGQFDQADEVFGPCGAAAVYRRDALDEVGFLDRRLFMYYEDLDLAWRLRRRGWRFRYEPRAVVRHVHCGSSGEGSPFFCEHVERSRLRATLVNADMGPVLWTALGLPLRIARSVWRLARRQTTPAHVRAMLRAGWGGLLELPWALHDRYRERRAARVPERALTGWMLSRPRKGTETCASSSMDWPPSSLAPASAATSPTCSTPWIASGGAIPSPASRPAA